MLIMNQTEDFLVNMDRIDNIHLEAQDIRKNAEYFLTAKVGDDSYWLGLYKNRERAKEVLGEIMDTFIEKEYFHINKSSLNNLDELAEPKYILRPVGSPKAYYMPKE